MIKYGGGFIIVSLTWAELKVMLDRKAISLQYHEDSSLNAYVLFAIDGNAIVYQTFIYLGTVPEGDSQAQNDADKSDFEANFKQRANQPVVPGSFGDPRYLYRFGNLTATGSSERLVSNRGYFEPSSQAQRSVVSTSAQDANPSGTGAKQVRITYLNSNYEKKVEDIFLNGTTPVNTAATDIRFIEKFEVIKGTNAVGAITLRASTTGGEICAIGPGTTDAFLCHHYVPSGSRGYVVKWGSTVSDDANLRLSGQEWVSGNLVDKIVDLDMMAGIASGSRTSFERHLSTPLQEKTYVRVTASPQQGTATTVRAYMWIWEDTLYVSGSS